MLFFFIRVFLLRMRFFMKVILLEIIKIGAPNKLNRQRTNELTTCSYSYFIVHIFCTAHLLFVTYMKVAGNQWIHFNAEVPPQLRRSLVVRPVPVCLNK